MGRTQEPAVGCSRRGLLVSSPDGAGVCVCPDKGYSVFLKGPQGFPVAFRASVGVPKGDCVLAIGPRPRCARACM